MNGLNMKNIIPNKNNTFCYYPFYALTMKLFDHNGKLDKVAPCCKMHNNETSLLTKEELTNLTPQQIFEHDKFNQLRFDGLNNVRNTHCKICWDQEDRDINSYRMNSSWIFQDEFKKDLREFDVSFSNKCNLVCRMCNIGGSHQFHKDIKFFQDNSMMEQVKKATGGAIYTPQGKTITEFDLSWLLDNFKQIQILKISGGEPLYDKKVLKLLNLILENGHAKNVVIQFHTNATLLDDNAIQMLNNFKQQAHVFSVDGTENIYNYIRYKSSFDLIENNIANWIYNSTNIRSVAFNMVLSCLNVLNIKKYIEWISYSFAYKHKIKIHISEIRPWHRGTSLYNMPIHLLEKSKTELIKLKNPFPNLIHYDLNNIIRLIELGIEQNTFEKNKHLLKSEIVLFDKSRNQNYRNFLDPLLIEVLEKI